MTISSYSDLVTAVTNYLARDDLSARVPEFIVLCEAKLSRELRCRQMEKRAYATISITDAEPQFIALPNDFQSMRSLVLASATGKPRVDYLPGEQIKDFRSNIGDTTAPPRYFGIFGDQIELVPIPDAGYRLEMVYRATIPALSSGNTTNWLIQQSPDAYLYGTLMEAEGYMRNDARIPLWAEGLKRAIDGLNGISTQAMSTPDDTST